MVKSGILNVFSRFDNLNLFFFPFKIDTGIEKVIFFLLLFQSIPYPSFSNFAINSFLDVATLETSNIFSANDVISAPFFITSYLSLS